MAEKVSAKFEAKISSMLDYTNLLNEKVDVNVPVEDAIIKRNFRQIDAAAREAIWKQLFEPTTPLSNEQQESIGRFLAEVKANAAFHSPWEYNEWIVKLRDELLKRNMVDFWCKQVVENELGPCWSRDSDLMDKSEETDPSAFYEKCGCVAPFKRRLADLEEKAQSNLAQHIKTLADYEKLMESRVKSEDIVDDDELQENYAEIAAATREAVWQSLFDKEPPTAEDFKRAEELLVEHKQDACFYAPWEYNEWIVKVRDELLKRNLLDFWRNVIVEKELGLCWARDSDYFDDLEDPAPRKFYEHAGCKAKFD